MTYKRNFPFVNVFEDGIEDYLPSKEDCTANIIFGGPPCQGFSTSNQRTRGFFNPGNWLFEEYFRVAEIVRPEWLVLENVKGILETKNGFFFQLILNKLDSLGYRSVYKVLDAKDYGVPQSRNRLFIIGNRKGKAFKFPPPYITDVVTVLHAIGDLPVIENGAKICILPYRGAALSEYAESMRNAEGVCANNVVSLNSRLVTDRYAYVPQGGNWTSIPDTLMKNYSDYSRCHTGIYHRLDETKPSVVIGNFRKNMLIHPRENRGISVREAARIQSFPDSFVFTGSIGFQQQQVGNAVPPMLAREIFNMIVAST